jgi:hypothetical protein
MTRELREFVERIAATANRREAILNQMVEAHVAYMALNRRASGDRDIGNQEIELYMLRNSLITDLVAAEQEYQSSENALREYETTSETTA